MNEKVFKKIRELKKVIKFNSLTGNKENMFCINSNESEEHIDKKFEICKELRKRGYVFYTECILNSGKRCDILGYNPLSGEGFIFEIVCSETKESIERKKNEYPSNFELFFVNTKDEEVEIPL